MLPVSEAIGVTRGDFGLWLIVNCIVTVISLPFWGRWMQTKNINFVLTAGAILLTIGILGFSFSSQLWMFLVFAVFTGLGMATMFALAGPTLIQNWFVEKYRGKMLGIAAAFTGIGTFIWAPLFTMIIQSAGWQTAYLVNGILAGVLMIPMALFVVKFKPEDKGLKPFGYIEGGEATQKVEDGVSAKRVFGNVAFYAIAIGLVFACLGMGYNSNQPGLAAEKMIPLFMDKAGAAMLGATMISVAAVGNLLGKIVFGAIADRAGLRVSFILFIILYILAFVLWLPTVPEEGIATTLLLVGAFMLGTHNAILSVGFPLLTRKIFGNKDFAKIWSYIAMPYTLVSGFGTSLVAYIYQGTGSYTASLYVGLGFVIVMGICALIALAYIGKVKWDSQLNGAEKTA